MKKYLKIYIIENRHSKVFHLAEALKESTNIYQNTSLMMIKIEGFLFI